MLSRSILIMVRRSLLITIVISVLMMNGVINYADTNKYKIFIDQVELKTDVEPFNTNGRIMVPVRAIFEAIGATVIWDPIARTVTGSKDNRVVFLKIDNKIAKINEDEHELDVPATIKESRTFVPLRFVSESLNMDVKWEDKTKTVSISTITTELTEQIEDIPAAPADTKKHLPINGITSDFKLIINDKNYNDILTYAAKIKDEQLYINSILLNLAFGINVKYDSEAMKFVLIYDDEILKTNVSDREWVSVDEIAKEKNMVVEYEGNTVKIKSDFGKQSNNDVVVQETKIDGSINAILTAIVEETPVRNNGKTVYTRYSGRMLIRIESEEEYLKLKKFDSETLKKVMYDYIMENRTVFKDYVLENKKKFLEYITIYGEVLYGDKELLNITVPDAADYEDVTLFDFF